ncbi:hypothetical protein [Haloarcula nitratireducens]|uniref:Lipoprotein n=1 Tax=Haloarcula nitratireducens TaxID=2487749 RepID=A0AAW4PCQ1_9EURY|nr:hypothetical protein [Halomicroarcula nitratireducens]MBX0295481.1 hypothetical protein [Halomicroarcula nitratireducens]
MRRRQFLAGLSVAAVAPLAGCSDPRGSIRLTDVSDDAALAERWTRSADALTESSQELVAGAVEDDDDARATAAATSPPLELARPVRYEGSYYDISYEATNEREETSYDVVVTFNPDPAPETTVAFADLPAVDREVLDGLLESRWDRTDETNTRLGTPAVYTDAETAESVVVPEPEYDGVTRDDRTVGIGVDGSRLVTVADYRYRAELLAEDAAGIAALARERYRFEFADLSAEQRSILDEAKGGEARSEDPPSRAFTDLVEKFRAHDGLDVDEYGGTWLLGYDGRDWWAMVRDPRGTPTAG